MMMLKSLPGLLVISSLAFGKTPVVKKTLHENLEGSPKAKIKDITAYVKSRKAAVPSQLALWLLKAESAKENQEFHQSAKYYSEILTRYGGETGKVSLTEFLQSKSKLSKDKPNEIKKAIAQLRVMHKKKRLPLFYDSKDITDDQLAPFVRSLGLATEKVPSQTATTPESVLPQKPGIPPSDLLLSDLIKKRCSNYSKEKPETKSSWDSWARETGVGLDEYVKAMVKVCLGQNTAAEESLKKLFTQKDFADKFPALHLTGLRQLAFLQRRSPSRMASIETYQRLAELWDDEALTTENSGLDTTEITYQKASDLAWACRVSTWTSQYSKAEDFCEDSIAVAKDWLEEEKNKSNARYASFIELVAEGYQTIADRIDTEKEDWKSAKKRVEEALSLNLEYGSNWKNRLKWHVAFYTWLSGDYKQAESLFLASFDPIESKSEVDRGLFWAARSAKSAGNEDAYRMHVTRLKKDFPLSYYSLVAIPQLEKLAPTINGLSQSILSSRILYENDLGKILSKPTDASLKADFQSLGVLIMFDVQPWALYLARDIHEQVKKRSSPKDDPEAWSLSAKALLAAGDPSKAMSVASLMNQSVRDFFEKRPEMLFYVYPSPWLEHFEASAKTESVSISTLLAISRQESTFTPHIVSPARAIGLMQLIVPTADRMAKLKGLKLNDTFEDLQQPAINIRLGTAYLALLSKRYAGNETYAIAAYNAGEAMIDLWIKNRKLPDLMSWIEAIPFGETRTYVKTVLRNKAVYDLQGKFKGAGINDNSRIILGILEQGLKNPENM